MANAFYKKGKQNLLAGNLDWDGQNVRVLFLDETDDPPNLSTDDALDDILSAARVFVATDNLAGRTCTDGVADATDYVASSVGGDEFESIVIFTFVSGSEPASYLWVNLDTGTGLPCTPNSGDITVQWDDGANKIFVL